jgi:protein-S-isoprenylcysteine O-methyltransferase Ste14
VGKLLAMIIRSQWDRAAAIGAALLAALVLLLGYFGVASTDYPAEQIPYVVSGGITGILLMGAAATLWLSADMRDEWRKLDELAELTRTQQPAADEQPRPDAAA